MCPCWFAVFIWNGFNLGRLESCSLNHQNQYKHHKLLEFALGESISCTKLTEKTWIGRQTSSCLHVSSHVMTFEAYSECVWTDTSDMAWYDLKWMTLSEMASHMTCQCLPLLALHNLHPSFQIMQAEPRLNSSLSKEAEAAQASGVCTSASWSCVNGINEWRDGLPGQFAPGCEHQTKAHPIKGVIVFMLCGDLAAATCTHTTLVMNPWFYKSTGGFMRSVLKSSQTGCSSKSQDHPPHQRPAVELQWCRH